jgi:hypothetical protein
MRRAAPAVIHHHARRPIAVKTHKHSFHNGLTEDPRDPYACYCGNFAVSVDPIDW